MRTCAGCCQVVSGTKQLICPTCAKLGRDASESTFCSQECFKSNWKVHKSQHDLVPASISLQAPSNKGIGTTGVQVITHDSRELDRVLVATRSFRIGDIVLEEDPLVVFRVGWPDLLTKYATSMTEEDKIKLLDMQHLSSANDAKHEEFIRSISQSFDHAMKQPVMHELLRIHQVDEAFAFRLCTLVNINGHMYHGHLDSKTEKDDEPLTALFYLGSKTTHSCDPNTAYSSKCDRSGKLTYYATKEIHEGDLITFSYINAPLLLPTRERKNELLRTKDFLCQCTLCLAPDWLTGLKCDRKKDGGSCQGMVREVLKEATDRDNNTDTHTVQQARGATTDSSCWQCTLCGPCKSVDLTSSTSEATAKGSKKGKKGKKELSKREQLQQYEEALKTIQHTVDNEGVSPELVDALEKLLTETSNPSNGIGACHHLYLQLLQTLSTSLETAAMLVEEINGGTVTLMSKQYRTRCTNVLLQLTKLLEGIHVKCVVCCSTLGGASNACTVNHSPAPGCEEYVLSAAIHCLTSRTPFSAPIADAVSKYQPYMTLSYGVDDTAVREVYKTLLSTTSKK